MASKLVFMPSFSSECTLLLLDVSRLIWRAWRRQLPTGIDRACLAYMQHYSEHALAVVQRGGFTCVLSRHHSDELFELLGQAPGDFRKRLVALLAKSFLGRRVSSNIISNAFYLNVGHTGLDRAGHSRWVRRSGVRAVYYVHDLIPITHSQYARAGEPERHAARMEAVLHNGHAIIANSDDSIAALTSFADSRQLAVPAALKVPLGVETLHGDHVDTNMPPLDRPYFITLGTIEARKNHRLLLNIWHKLINKMGKEAPRLVIVGQRGWMADDVFAALDGDTQLKPYIHELGRCKDDELAVWLLHARALLFPSYVEGQGLPMIEALAMGTPVIASDLLVFRETAGDIAEYIDLEKEDEWLQAVADYSQADHSRRGGQIARMGGYTPPTWQEHFCKVDAWLSQLSERSNT